MAIEDRFGSRVKLVSPLLFQGNLLVMSAEAEYLSLAECNPGNAAVGTWLVRLVKTRVFEHVYAWQGQEKISKRWECVSVSPDPHEYCISVLRRKGPGQKNVKEFDAGMQKYKQGLMWSVSDVAFLKENPSFVSAPLKHVIDIANSKFVPVLQSTFEMPTYALPPDDLAGLVELEEVQRVDVIALVKSMDNVHMSMTSRGERKIVDVTLMDGSVLQDSPVFVTITMFFSLEQQGKDDFALLQECCDGQATVSFFGLTAIPRENDQKCEFKTSDRFFFEKTPAGPKKDRLDAEGGKLLSMASDELHDISHQEAFVPNESKDWKTECAVLSCCALVQASLDGGQTLYARALPEHEPIRLLQLNYVRVLEPGPKVQVTTKDGSRLFVPVDVMDHTYSVGLRMQESAALELSNCTSKAEFEAACVGGQLCFPMLCSLRVEIRMSGGSASEHAKTDDQEENLPGVNAIVRTAEEQRMGIPFVPNTSAMELKHFLQTLRGRVDRMAIAEMHEVNYSAHAGLVTGSTKSPCKVVLSMIANQQKSKVAQFGKGHRVITNGVNEVLFNEAYEKDTVQRRPLEGQMASMSTLENVAEFSLTPAAAGELQFFLISISGMSRSTDGQQVFSIDTRRPIPSGEVDTFVKILRALRKVAEGFPHQSGQKRSLELNSDSSPYTGKKPRELSEWPTGESLGCGSR